MRCEYTAEFEAFWLAYPRRIAKKEAFKAFQKAMREGADIEQILKAVEAYKKWLSCTEKWRPEPAHPTTWLNQGRYEDELEDAAPQPVSVSYKLPAEIVSKLKLVGMQENTIKRWFDDCQFIDGGKLIAFPTKFMLDYVKNQFEGHLRRAFGTVEFAMIDKGNVQKMGRGHEAVAAAGIEPAISGV